MNTSHATRFLHRLSRVCRTTEIVIREMARTNPDKSDVRDVAQDISVGLFIETVFAESNCYGLEYLG